MLNFGFPTRKGLPIVIANLNFNSNLIVPSLNIIFVGHFLFLAHRIRHPSFERNRRDLLSYKNWKLKFRFLLNLRFENCLFIFRLWPNPYIFAVQFFEKTSYSLFSFSSCTTNVRRVTYFKISENSHRHCLASEDSARARGHTSLRQIEVSNFQICHY